MGLIKLQTHLPQLAEFLKPHVESFGTTRVNAFFRQPKSDEIMASGNFTPPSAKFKFDPKLLDSVKEAEEAVTLLAPCVHYVSEAYIVLRIFVCTAFTLNRKEINIELINSDRRLSSPSMLSRMLARD